MAIPAEKDSVLVGYMQNFTGQIVATPGAFGVLVPTATALDAATDAFIASYNALITARANGVRSVTLTNDKNTKRDAMLLVAREVYGQVQDSLSVSDTQKLGLGITVKGQEPTPQPVPGTAPVIVVKKVDKRTVTLCFKDASDLERKGRPLATEGLTLFFAVGASAPNTAEGWTFQGSTGKTTVDVVVPQSVADGAKVWFTAFWFNNRKQSGPLAAAVGTNIQGGSSVVTA